ncbi:L,D-transpeptidase [Leifsonia sp. 21MFCrub1.1]|uniref:L,D-transpeptidase n=1 Tax=Leifsonia sp. 21MFCrub1.1 TaxID=1798223 RepID=UPI0008928CE3|nr:L,D-transpeptidase [Leifsonia sp. 21MFCrub1.1]SEA35430.1 L,D-transpeptidase catalytic domain [Leifsonia sp. 21MFCrub1.1]
MTDPLGNTGTRPRLPQTRRGRRLWVSLAAGTVVIVTAAVAVWILQAIPSATGLPPQKPARASAAQAQDIPVPTVPADALRRLPEARYDAVIGGLLPYTGDAGAITESYRISSDVPVFGADRRIPVARLSAKDFVGASTTVVVVKREGPWSLVLTPARIVLPSASRGNAPAQSAGWVAGSALERAGALHDRIVVSVSEQKLSILHDGSVVSRFAVGVGTPGTPTPTGVTGYLQQRYLDPRQGQTVFPIQLTSLHASAQDEPYGGNDGGLIGIHYNRASVGAVSHGCLRLAEDAITAVDSLPLGTPITITT